MMARYAGASLGLLAFFVAVAAGLLARNPATVTLSRGIFALLLFCLIGLVIGAAAQRVVAEHEKGRESDIRERYRPSPPGAEGGETKEPDTTSKA